MEQWLLAAIVLGLTHVPFAAPVQPAAAKSHLQSPPEAPLAVLHLPLSLHGGLDAIPVAPTAAPPRATPTSAVPTATPPGPIASPSATTEAPPGPPSPTVLPPDCDAPLADGGFERGPGEEAGWERETLDETELLLSAAARRGDFGARLGGRPGAEDVLLSTTVLPTFAAESRQATLRLWLRIDTMEPQDGVAQDRLLLAVVGDLPEAIEPIAFLGDEHAASGEPPAWQAHAFDLGEALATREDFATARLALVALLDANEATTTFDIDDVAIELCPPSPEPDP